MKPINTNFNLYWVLKQVGHIFTIVIKKVKIQNTRQKVFKNIFKEMHGTIIANFGAWTSEGIYFVTVYRKEKRTYCWIASGNKPEQLPFEPRLIQHCITSLHLVRRRKYKLQVRSHTLIRTLQTKELHMLKKAKICLHWVLLYFHSNTAWCRILFLFRWVFELVKMRSHV